MTNIMRTPEEKERIVKEYRNAPISLRGIAEKYKTSTRCILNWTNKYETLGIKGLQSATGKKCGSNKGQGPRKPKSREKELSRQSDIAFIKEVYEKHPSHGYRWINSFIKNKYGIIMSNNHVHLCCKYENIRSMGKHYQWKKPGEQQCKFNNLVWDGWKNLSRPLEVVVSDMTSFWVKGIYYELTMYFDAWSKEIIGYGISSRKGDVRSYYEGLKQVLERIKKEQTDQVTILHTDQGSVYSSESYNKLLEDYNIQRSMSRVEQVHQRITLLMNH